MKRELQECAVVFNSDGNKKCHNRFEATSQKNAKFRTIILIYNTNLKEGGASRLFKEQFQYTGLSTLQLV